MAQNKKTRASKYNDKAFTYDPVGNYELSDFKNLSLLKIHGIAAILNIRNVKKNKREQLIPFVLMKHHERRNRALSEEKGEEREEQTEPTIESIFVSTAHDVQEFSEQFKNQCLKMQHFKYNGHLWFHAASVASYLEYSNPNDAIFKLVDACDKISYDTLISSSSQKSSTVYNPRSIFINEKGLFKLIHRSKMPLATGKKRSVEEVYVATTVGYEKKEVYKIGKSECSKKRMTGLNTGRAPDDDLYLCYVASCYNAYEAEQSIHDALDEYRIAPNREFFKLSLDKIKSVVDNICSHQINKHNN